MDKLQKRSIVLEKKVYQVYASQEQVVDKS